jgi:hypothetical protein
VKLTHSEKTNDQINQKVFIFDENREILTLSEQPFNKYKYDYIFSDFENPMIISSTLNAIIYPLIEADKNILFLTVGQRGLNLSNFLFGSNRNVLLGRDSLFYYVFKAIKQMMIRIKYDKILLELYKIVDDKFLIDFKEIISDIEKSTFLESKVLLPPVQWNAMFLTYHACAHLLSEGLRLKQILDWTMFLKKEQNNVDWKAFYEYCDRYHFRRFVDAMTAISIKYLGIAVDNPEITTESPHTEKILKSTLYDDDYIYNVGENIWKSRWHVIRSLFKYRWRYEEIYEESVWKQLWWYASGFLLHTEK